ncbi:MAG: hypothetical protein SF182_28940 [Deltaproteobacteria bacterium]|nr:hypothetical protein [Deltaproteobacteria bacterium]
MRIRGEVVRHRVARGSKSARTAVLLRSGEREYLLRRPGGAYRDEALEALVGKTIDAEGEVRAAELFLTAWRVVD